MMSRVVNDRQSNMLCSKKYSKILGIKLTLIRFSELLNHFFINIRAPKSDLFERSNGESVLQSF